MYCSVLVVCVVIGVTPWDLLWPSLYATFWFGQVYHSARLQHLPWRWTEPSSAIVDGCMNGWMDGCHCASQLICTNCITIFACECALQHTTSKRWVNYDWSSENVLPWKQLTQQTSSRTEENETHKLMLSFVSLSNWSARFVFSRSHHVVPLLSWMLSSMYTGSLRPALH